MKRIRSKNLLVCLLALCLAFVLAGCGEKQKPEDAVNDFFTGLTRFDTVKMQENVAAAAQSDVEQKELIGEKEQFLTAYFQKNAAKVTYEIKEVQVDGDTAKVQVHCRYVDMTEMFGQSMAEYLKQSMGLVLAGHELTDEEASTLLKGIVTEKIETVPEAFAEKDITLELVKEDKKWKLKEVPSDLADVLFSNFVTVSKTLASES